MDGEQLHACHSDTLLKVKTSMSIRCPSHGFFTSNLPRRYTRKCCVACNSSKDLCKLSAQDRHSFTCQGTGRRQQLLTFMSLSFMGSVLSGTDDPTTVINSVLGAYGLPKLQGSSEFRLFDNFDEGYAFEYPRSWVGRTNTLREGIYIADFNTADKAVLEIFMKPSDSREEIQEVIRRAVSPGAEVGGDARLILPDERRIKTEIAEIDGQEYTYIRFPSETVTRSGYQIKRKNLAVAASKKGRVYSLVASARSDQYNPAKEKVLLHIVQSFRLRT